MLKVTCALILNNNRILVTRRGPGMRMAGKWEFPGGKVEAGETAEQCIRRECLEELGLNIRITGQLSSHHHDYGDVAIVLIPFLATIESGELSLKEHDQFEWATREQLRSFDWAEADVAVVEEFLMNND